MTDFAPSLKLTHVGALKMLNAGVAKALEMNQPQCITITDEAGHLLAFIRMDGAKLLSIDTSRKKAITAASMRAPSGQANVANEIKLAIATDGKLTNLVGGLPVIIDGHVVGAIGVGSGTSEQDLEVATAAVESLSDIKKR